MTNEERQKAAEWFRNRAKNCPMPGARRMYEIATEALEMAIRALEGDGDMISRQAVMKEFKDFVRKSNNSDFAQTPTWNDAVSLVGSMPSAQPERLTDDDFETIRIHLNAYKEKLCNQQRWEEAEEYQRIIDRFMAFASAQPETHDKRTETHACDLINRQQAIDYCEALMNAERLQQTDDWGYGRERYNQTECIMHYIENMPSAQPEKTCCGYDEKELIAFAIACRRNEVDEKDLKTFAQDCEFAWRVMQEEFESKIREAFEKWTGGKSDAD